MSEDNTQRPANPEKVWITKYALTSGMEVKDNTAYKIRISETHPDLLEVIGLPVDGRVRYWELFHSTQWHTSEKAARAQVRKMVAAKLKSIEKQRAKMLKLQAEYADKG